jgi:hypothetical protein
MDRKKSTLALISWIRKKTPYVVLACSLKLSTDSETFNIFFSLSFVTMSIKNLLSVNRKKLI